MVDPRTLELKLVDFGSTARTKHSAPLTEYIVTRWYRPPECLLTSGSYGPGIDIWATGCILYEMVTGVPLFPGTDEFDQIEVIHSIIGTPSAAVINRFLSNPNDQFNYRFPPSKGKKLRSLLPSASDRFVDLLVEMLRYDPQKRITARKALKLPVFEAIREEFELREPLPVSVDSAPMRSSRTNPAVLIVNPRLQGGRCVKRYAKPRQRPRAFFSLHERHLLPVLDVKQTFP
jgi:serine/threonine protein kinase